MITFLEQAAEPDGDGGTDTNPLPVTMGRDVCINEVTDTHVLHNAEEQGEAVDLFTGDGKRWLHIRQRTTLGSNSVHHLPER